jgi:hypothetical protein
MSVTEAEVDKAAAQLTVCLMRLCEALELKDLTNYNDVPERRLNGISAATQRRYVLTREYKSWFKARA